MKLVKGSAQAIAWGKKMQKIREAGAKTERKFFGKRGIFARAGHTKHSENPKRKSFKHWIKRNPGAAWHEGVEQVARRYSSTSREPLEKAMFKGVEVAHHDSAKAAKRLGMNPKRRYTPARAKKNPSKWEPPSPWTVIAQSKSTGDKFILASDGNVYSKSTAGWVNHGTQNEFTEHALKHWKPLNWFRKNPLAVFGFGNPPARINAGIAGVIYNRCLEIRAEKTGYKKGLYRHPFSKSSCVQILALDNGDLLVHSTRKMRLWKRS